MCGWKNHDRFAGETVRLKVVTLTTCVLLILTGPVVQARQARGQFSIHAASDKAVQGWNRMEFENKTVWVSPTASVSPSDILRGVKTTEPDGRLSVGITFADTGAQKMLNLTYPPRKGISSSRWCLMAS
jgi:hypothetical protein